MPREIKFRAWHKQEKKMYIPNYLHFSPECRLFGVLIKEGQLLSIDDFELMQYTGLKDSKGQEIYESDVVRLEGITLASVEYGDGRFMINVDGFGFALNNFVPEYIEVLGNIYENSELLEVTHAK